jgi:hypothetical protein
VQFVVAQARHRIHPHWQDTAETACKHHQILGFARVFTVTQRRSAARIED